MDRNVKICYGTVLLHSFYQSTVCSLYKHLHAKHLLLAGLLLDLLELNKGSIKSLLDILAQILSALNTNGDADQAVSESDGLTVGAGHGSVGHEGRGAGKGLNGTKRHSKTEDLQGLQELGSDGQTTLNVHGHHGTRTLGLGLGELILRIRRKARIVASLDDIVLLDDLGKGNGVLLAGLHADVESLKTTHGHVAVERTRDSTDEVLKAAELLADLIVVGHGSTHDHIRVTTDPLGQTVHDNISAQLQRTLKVGAHEGAIDNKHDVVLLGDLGDTADIEGLHEGVGRSLEPDHLGLGSNGLLDGLKIVHGHEVELDAGMRRDDVAEDTSGAAVQVIGGDDVITSVQQLSDGGDSSHTRGKGRAVLGVLSSSEGALKSTTGRVVLAGVEVTKTVRGGIIQTRLQSRISLDVSRGHIDRRNNSVVVVLSINTSVHSLGGKLVVGANTAAAGSHSTDNHGKRKEKGLHVKKVNETKGIDAILASRKDILVVNRWTVLTVVDGWRERKLNEQVQP